MRLCEQELVVDKGISLIHNAPSLEEPALRVKCASTGRVMQSSDYRNVLQSGVAKSEWARDSLPPMENNIRRWGVSGRVLLFLISCAVLLASTAPLERRFPGLPPGLFTGAITSLGTLVLTVIFVRWEKLRLEDVGAAFSRKSPLRFVVGFLVGLILVALHVSVEALVGQIRWVRSEGVDSLAIAASLIVYVLLACRENWPSTVILCDGSIRYLASGFPSSPSPSYSRRNTLRAAGHCRKRSSEPESDPCSLEWPRSRQEDSRRRSDCTQPGILVIGCMVARVRAASGIRLEWTLTPISPIERQRSDTSWLCYLRHSRFGGCTAEFKNAVGRIRY
jgi:hypothetical protein